ncbi:uncharacterized protein LOC129914473 [Episyrphus balteatus]|uniref:uncharacterized protein LOC129914473 n=1 Tax=Episyrphus balteatus TaxID=286459 RepID=UPI002484E417|nr:uncharacterized protein LOC129914473 [Episyrphus balteatus]
MNTVQRSRLIQLIKQHFPYTDPCDVDHVLQWEIIAETLNALGPPQTIDEWIENWESMKNCAHEKLKAINKSKENDSSEIPKDLKLTEEDHRILKITGFQNDSNKMAKLVKMLDCGAVSPFENEFSDSDDGSDIEDIKNKQLEEVGELKNGLNDVKEIIAERNIALEQLEEQKKINVQLAELLAIFKLPPAQNTEAN